MGSYSYIDWILAAVYLLIAVLLFLGKGKRLLNAFSGKNHKIPKMDEKTNRKYQTGVGVFVLVLAITEVLMAIFESSVMGIISLIVLVADLIGIVLFIRKMMAEN